MESQWVRAGPRCGVTALSCLGEALPAEEAGEVPCRNVPDFTFETAQLTWAIPPDRLPNVSKMWARLLALGPLAFGDFPSPGGSLSSP